MSLMDLSVVLYHYIRVDIVLLRNLCQEYSVASLLSSSNSVVYSNVIDQMDIFGRPYRQKAKFLALLTHGCCENDNHCSTQQTFAAVQVIIEDVNDNTPMFSSSTYSGTVQENTELGTTVLAVSTCICP